MPFIVFFSVLSNTIIELLLKLILTFDQMYSIPIDSKMGNSYPNTIKPNRAMKILEMLVITANIRCNRLKKKKKSWIEYTDLEHCLLCVYPWGSSVFHLTQGTVGLQEWSCFWLVLVLGIPVQVFMISHLSTSLVRKTTCKIWHFARVLSVVTIKTLLQTCLEVSSIKSFYFTTVSQYVCSLGYHDAVSVMC